jgi:hypothetical protein
MAKGKFEIPGYDSFSGCDIVVTARMSTISSADKAHEKVYTLGSLQTLSISTHQDKRPVRAIGNMNAIDYTMGQRTIAGSMVFAVFDKHFATEMFNDINKSNNKSSIIMPDELPPLDITVTLANEYGRTARMAIYGVRLINEGQVMSINDIFTENTYQFVANALEPLNEGETNGSSSTSNTQTVIEDGVSNVKAYNNIGSEIVAYINNNNLNVKEDDIKLSVNIEHPSNLNILGIAKFQLTPNQIAGYINIVNLITNTTKRLYIESFYGQTILHTEIEPGNYSAIYQEGSKDSNTVMFTVNSQSVVASVKNDPPVIERLSATEISITSNNPLHTHAVVYSTDAGSETIELTSKKAVIKNLSPNTTYYIKTVDDTNNSSKTAVTTTLAYENQDKKMFIEYVNNNNNLLLKPIEEYKEILDEVEQSNTTNIIDSLTAIKEDNKSQELLLYATKFQNELNNSFNSSNGLNMPSKVLSSPFNDVIKHDADAVKSNYFSVKKKKNYFDSSIVYPSTHVFEGISNSRYFTYDIDKNGSRGIRYDFCSFNQDAKIYLERYKETDVASTLDIEKYRNMYPKVSTQALYLVAAKDNKKPNINILEAPNVISSENGILTIDVDYTEIIGKSTKSFYMCLAEASEALDYTPFRKVKFNKDDILLVLDKYVTGIVEGKTYLLWIEDENYNIISRACLFNTVDNMEINYIKSQETSKELTAIKKGIENTLGKSQVLDSIFPYLTASDIPFKDLYQTIEQELINYTYSQFKSDMYLFELLKYKFNKNNSMKELCTKVVYGKDEKYLIFKSNKSCNVSVFEYELGQSLPTKIAKDVDEAILINNSKAYTVAYLIEETLMAISGFVLINNSTGEYLSYNINLEVI